MSELEEFFSACGQHLRGITQPDALAGEFSADGRRGFTDQFEKGGGEILDIIKVPSNLDFLPFLKRVTE